MKKFLMLTLLLALCCALLPARAENAEPLVAFANAENADFDTGKQAPCVDYWSVYLKLDKPFLSGEGLPEGFSVSDVGSHILTVLNYETPDGETVIENADKYRLEILEGDPLFAEVFCLGGGNDNIFKWVEPFTEMKPGATRLRLQMESEHCYYCREYTVQVVSFADAPLFTLPGKALSLEYRVGDIVTEDGYRGLIAALLKDAPGLTAFLDELCMQDDHDLFNGLLSRTLKDDWVFEAAAAGVYDGTFSLYFRNLTVTLPVHLTVLE